MTALESQPARFRWPLALGVGIAAFGLGYFLLVCSCRIDTMEGSAFMVGAAPERAVPLGISAFFLALDFGRHWTRARRLVLATLAFGVAWTIAWQMLAYQARYPERYLRNGKTSTVRPTEIPAFAPGRPLGRPSLSPPT
jgi:hypothetical protein